MATGVVIPFALGFVWMLMTGVQTKLIVKAPNLFALFAWAVAISLVWGYLIRVIAVSRDAVISYAVGTGLGIVLAKWLVDRYQN